jgi:hypothetical protein
MSRTLEIKRLAASSLASADSSKRHEISRVHRTAKTWNGVQTPFPLLLQNNTVTQKEPQDLAHYNRGPSRLPADFDLLLADYSLALTPTNAAMPTSSHPDPGSMRSSTLRSLKPKRGRWTVLRRSQVQLRSQKGSTGTMSR